MPINKPLRINLSKHPELAQIFSEEDPESLFYDQREIGHGSFGAVYFARHTKTDEIAAIKKMQFSGKKAVEKWEDIVKEVKFFSQLKHDNIVMFKGCYLKDSTCWLVMEYCVGSVSDVMEVHKAPLQETEIAEICKGVLLALQFIHSQDKIHRDVKAGNILLTDKGIVKLADFGSVSDEAKSGSFVGTPFWMAPEVIMAMEEGQYDCRSDIWSVGITCIEMAERKPPLFHMSPMPAMYHIPQNDPPTLKESDQWSETFKDFIKCCLVKDPEDRYTTERALEHAFITSPRSHKIIYKLIVRTKESVKQVDRQNFRRLQKMLMGESSIDDEAQSDNTDTESTNTGDILDPTGEEICLAMNSLSVPSLTRDDDKSCSSTSSSVKEGVVPMNELSSYENKDIIEDSEIPEQRSRGKSEPMVVRSEHTGEVFSPSPSTTSLLSNVSIGSSSQTSLSVSITPYGSRVKETRERYSIDGSSMVGNRPSILNLEELAKRMGGNQPTDGFSTLRSHAAVTKEVQDHQLQSDLKDQMAAYKRMRAQHKKQMEQFQAKQRSERLALLKICEKELEQIQQMYVRDMEKLTQNNRTEFERKLNRESSEERKFRRSLRDKQDQEMKHFTSQQKTDYRATKAIFKKRIDDDATLTPNQRRKLYDERKSELLSQQKESEMEHMQVLKTIGEHDTVDFKQRMLHDRQALEKRLLQEELNLMQLNKERVQEAKKKQQRATAELLLKQLADFYEMKADHLNKQHYLECDNQMSCGKKAERELKKKHVSELKQHPKGLKARKQQIRSSFHDTVRIQQKQYKSLQKHIASNLPKEKQKEILEPLKEEQMRKMSQLALQYEKTIDEVLQQQTVKLDEAQVAEEEGLRRQLQQEREMLKHFQEKHEIKLLYQQEKEKKSLDDKLEAQQRELEKEIFEESTKLQNLRLERQQQLQRKHLNEWKEFAEKYSTSDLHASGVANGPSQ